MAYIDQRILALLECESAVCLVLYPFVYLLPNTVSHSTIRPFGQGSTAGFHLLAVQPTTVRNLSMDLQG